MDRINQAKDILARYGLEIAPEWDGSINCWHRWHQHPLFKFWSTTYSQYIERIIEIDEKPLNEKAVRFNAFQPVLDKNLRYIDLMEYEDKRVTFRKEYQDKRDQFRKEYQDKCAQFRKEYEDKCAPFWKEYEYKCVPFRKEYGDKRVTFWKEYEDKRAPFLKEYEDKCDQFRKEYQDKCAQFRKEYEDKFNINEIHSKELPNIKIDSTNSLIFSLCN